LYIFRGFKYFDLQKYLKQLTKYKMAFRMKFRGAAPVDNVQQVHQRDLSQRDLSQRDLSQRDLPHRNLSREDNVQVDSVSDIRTLSSLLENKKVINPYKGEEDYKPSRSVSQQVPSNLYKTIFLEKTFSLSENYEPYFSFPFDGENFNLSTLLFMGDFPSNTKFRIMEAGTSIADSLCLKDNKTFKWDLKFLYNIPTTLTSITVLAKIERQRKDEKPKKYNEEGDEIPNDDPEPEPVPSVLYNVEVCMQQTSRLRDNR